MDVLLGLIIISWAGAVAPALTGAVCYLVDRVILEGTRT